MQTQSIADAALARNLTLALVHQAKAAYPTLADTQRISKALALLMSGHVTLHADGTATVRSQSGCAEYRVNGSCTCPDAQYRALDGKCKHRWSKALSKAVQHTLAHARYAQYGASEGIAWVCKNVLWFLEEGTIEAQVVDINHVILCGWVTER